MRVSSNLLRGLDWGLYDFANSGYYLVYVILLLPIFLRTGVLRNDEWFAAKWGVVQGGSVLLAVLLGLLFGRRFDRIGVKVVARFAMVVPAVLSLLFPILIAFHAGGTSLLLCYFLVHGVYLLSLTIYDASLAHVSSRNDFVGISGWAWGWGYVGGLLCIATMQIGLLFWDRYSPEDFATGSMFFLLFSCLAAVRLGGLFRSTVDHTRVSDPESEVDTTQETHFETSLERWKLLLVFVFVVDGVAIFFFFFSIYAVEVAVLPEREITNMMAALQLLAFPLTGWISGMTRRGLAPLLWFCGIAWSTAVLLILLFPAKATIWVAIVMVSSTVGTTQSILRAIYANTVTKADAVRNFSLYAVVEKGASFLGPTLAGFAIVIVGYKAVIGLAALMILGGCGYLAMHFAKTAKTHKNG